MDGVQRVHDFLHQMALESAFWSGGQPVTYTLGQDQFIPVNVYETPEDVVIVAPMPGVEAENIDIEIVGSVVTLKATMRGVGQDDRTYLSREWTYGPYARTLTLPLEVDAQHANASHGNGILVLSIPKAPRSRAVKVPLRQITASEAIHHGHSGHHTTRQGLERDAPDGDS